MPRQTLPVEARRAAAALGLIGQNRADAGQPVGYHLSEIRAETVGEQPDGEGPKSADVYVFDYIGGWGGVTADDFVRDVAGLDVDHIDLHLNSPGGSAMEGVAIANVLRQHRATVTVWVDGLAASAASVIAMAGDEVVMGIGSQLMIHDASALCVGPASEMRKAAEMLDSTSDAYAAAYAAKAGGTPAEWRAVMVAEQWFTGPEAVEAKLADRVATDEDKGKAGGEQIVPGSSSSSLWDLWDELGAAARHQDTVRALYAHAGRADAPPPQTPASASADGSNTATEEGSRTVAFTDQQLTTMRQQLGLQADADEATICAALSEALAEQAEPPLTPTASLPPGIVAIDEATLATLQANAARGVAADEKLAASRREQLVDDAIADGRIPKARRDHWLAQLKADAGTEETLAGLAKGLIPVTEIGHGGNDADVDTVDGLTGDELDAWASAAGLPEGALRG